MFLVVSRGNLQEINYAGDYPRFLSESPRRALEEARKIWEDPIAWSVSDVLVFKIDAGQLHGIKEFVGTNEDPAPRLMYIGRIGGAELRETFFNNFESLASDVPI